MLRPVHELQMDHLLRPRTSLLRLQPLQESWGRLLDHREKQRDHELKLQEKVA